MVKCDYWHETEILHQSPPITISKCKHCGKIITSNSDEEEG
jgi:hypothetical protein